MQKDLTVGIERCMEPKLPKLTKEELEQYFDVCLKKWLKWAVMCCLDRKTDESKLKETIANNLWEDLVERMTWDKMVLESKRAKGFDDKSKMLEWVMGQDIADMVKDYKEKNQAVNANAPVPMYLSQKELKADLKKSIETYIEQNPEADPKEVTSAFCEQLIKKSQSESEVERLEFELKKAVGELCAKIPEDKVGVFKSIISVIDDRLFHFPPVYLDALSIIEYVKQGGVFVNPELALPVAYDSLKDSIKHEQGDGDVAV